MGRSGVRGVLVGALTLIVLQALVSSPNAGKLADLFRVPGNVALRFLDPTIPAIPQRDTGDEGPDGFRGRAGGLSSLKAKPGAEGPVRRYPDPFRVPTTTSTGGGD